MDSERTRGSYCKKCHAGNMRNWRLCHRERNLVTGKRADEKRRKLFPEKMLAKRRDNRRRVAMFQPEKSRAQYLRKYRSLRARAIERLGGRCRCCGETMPTFLEIDHIHNDGHIERAGRRAFSSTQARIVLRHGNPGERYQVLCANCNRSKVRNGGTCEHKTRVIEDLFARFQKRFNASRASA